MSFEVRTVVMVEETLRSYRIPFYQQLFDALNEDGRRLVVAYSPDASWAVTRGDVILDQAAWSQPTPFMQIGRFAGRDITHQSIAEILRGSRDPLVIVNQAVSKGENYTLAYQHLRGRIGLAMWGHGRTYSVRTSRPAEFVKRELTRRSDWFFSYTENGARHVADYGFPASRISVVRNTIDTNALTADLDSVVEDDVATFRGVHGLTPGRTGLYLGGVDERKGIDFLLEAARAIQREIPDFVLLVGGSGSLLPSVQRAQQDGAPVRALGRVDGSAKALALRAADILLIPEWIGLVAVDSLVSARPIVTTDHESHSCEFEYLHPGETCIVSPHDSSVYASVVADLLKDSTRLEAMAQACRTEASAFSLTAMVDAFRDGISAWDELRSRGLTGRARRPHGTPTGLSPLAGPLAEQEGDCVRVVALIACHNRVERTLACLRSLMEQRAEDRSIKVVLVDDGSTDGTSARVASEFPQVQIIHGLGDLFWAGAMAVAERRGVRQQYDYLLWLNDDVCLNEGAMNTLLTTAQGSPHSIVVGSLVDPVTHEPSYGGLRRTGRRPMRLELVASDFIGALDTFNGNVALIPRQARELIGPLDGAFAHAYADLDYGFRAFRSGVPMSQTVGAVGTCIRNHGPSMPSSVRARWQLSQTPTYQPWRSQVRFLRRHGGPLWPGYLVAGYLRILLGLRM